MVGLSWRRPALHPWNELCDGGGTSSRPNTSFSGRNGSPGVGSPAVSSPGRPADCLQPLALPGPLFLLCLVDCRLPLFHLSLWPLLPSVSHGGIASLTQQWQSDSHRATLCSAWSERTEWGWGATEAYWWLLHTSFFLSSLWPPHNDWPYHQSSWFNFQCFLHSWLCELLSLFLLLPFYLESEISKP